MGKTLTAAETTLLCHSITEIGGDNLLNRFNLAMSQGSLSGYPKAVKAFNKVMDKVVVEQSESKLHPHHKDLKKHYLAEAGIVKGLLKKMLTAMLPN